MKYNPSKSLFLAVAFAMILFPVAPSFAQEAGFWSAELWLSGVAFGLKKDCTVDALFKDPQFRTIANTDGNVLESRLVSMEAREDDLFVTVETYLRKSLAPRVVARTTLDLRWHRIENVVNVEAIDIDDRVSGKQTHLDHEKAYRDDEDWDTYTQTVVDLYTTFFEKASAAGPASP